MHPLHFRLHLEWIIAAMLFGILLLGAIWNGGV